PYLVCALWPLLVQGQTGALPTLVSRTEPKGIVTFQAPPPFGLRPVLVLPYSATETTTRVSIARDGTREAHNVEERKTYRDSAGRTRTERSEPLDQAQLPGGPRMAFIEIDDPVAGFHYILDPPRGIAHRVKLPQTLVSQPIRDTPPTTDAETSVQQESL